MAREDYNISGKPYTRYKSDKAAKKAVKKDYFSSRSKLGSYEQSKSWDYDWEPRQEARQQARTELSQAKNFYAQRDEVLTAKKNRRKSRTAQVQRRAFFEDDQSAGMTTGV